MASSPCRKLPCGPLAGQHGEGGFPTASRKPMSGGRGWIKILQIKGETGPGTQDAMAWVSGLANVRNRPNVPVPDTPRAVGGGG